MRKIDGTDVKHALIFPPYVRLTAFVLKSFAQAQPWIDVDQNELLLTSDWLRRHQNPKDGCFKKVGDLHNKAMAGGVKTPGTLTAYVIIALLEAGKLDVHRGFEDIF